VTGHLQGPLAVLGNPPIFLPGSDQGIVPPESPPAAVLAAAATSLETTDPGADGPGLDAVGDALAATGHDAGFLDIAAARDAGLDDWVDASHEKRAIRAVYNPTEPEEYRRPEPLAATFDGVLFVADTSASRGLGD
jgi:erythromycin esterase-like protein